MPPEGLRAALVAEAELGEKIMRALVLRRVSLIEQGAGVLLIGRGDCPETARLLGFLARNGQPHRHAEPGDAEVLDIVAAHPGAEDKPIAVCPDGRVLENPSETTLASCIGLTVPAAFAGRSFDVAIVGAGPAGLAAAVYAASEGLSVAVFDARAFGGQAGASTRIENYLGFPTGISGQALAGRAYTQALKFGAETSILMAVGRLDCSRADAGRLRLELAEGGAVEARTVVLAVGARYRRLEVEGLERFEGRGVWYWASPIEARMAQGQEVLLVGGNSAGQAAVFLSSRVKRIRMLVRWPLRQTMSQYLIERIAASELDRGRRRRRGHRAGGRGDGLERVRWRTDQGEVEKPIRHLFLFLGAEPATEWLADCAVVLQRGFVATGPSLSGDELGERPCWRVRSAVLAGAPASAAGNQRAGRVRDRRRPCRQRQARRRRDRRGRGGGRPAACASGGAEGLALGRGHSLERSRRAA